MVWTYLLSQMTYFNRFWEMKLFADGGTYQYDGFGIKRYSCYCARNEERLKAAANLLFEKTDTEVLSSESR